jgi:hypothetical protein
MLIHAKHVDIMFLQFAPNDTCASQNLPCLMSIPLLGVWLKIRERALISSRQFVRIFVPLVSGRLWFIFVKVSRVSNSPQMRDNWSITPSMVHVIPVDAFEKWVCFDGRGTSRYIAETLASVWCAEFGDEITSGRRNGGRISDASFNYSAKTTMSALPDTDRRVADILFINLHWVLVPEWRLSDQELVN